MQQKTQHSRVIVGVLSLAVLVGAALTSSPAQADTGAGPYYVPPAWDRTLPSAARFMALTNMASAAVLDRETGLVWEKSPAITQMSWDAARDICANLTTGNRKGWRLPSMPELASLVDPSVASPGPVLPPGHPFSNVQSGTYLTFWSATMIAGFPGPWIVRFTDGRVYDEGLSERAWCVRGGMNADAY